MPEPTLPDRLEAALDALFDLVETYGGERLEQQQAMWGAIENAIEDLAEASIAEGRRQATDGWERHLRWRTAGGSTMELIEPNVAAYVAMSRRLERQYGYQPGELQRRLVGPWEPAEQPGGDRG